MLPLEYQARRKKRRGDRAQCGERPESDSRHRCRCDGRRGGRTADREIRHTTQDADLFVTRSRFRTGRNRIVRGRMARPGGDGRVSGLSSPARRRSSPWGLPAAPRGTGRSSKSSNQPPLKLAISRPPHLQLADISAQAGRLVQGLCRGSDPARCSRSFASTLIRRAASAARNRIKLYRDSAQRPRPRGPLQPH